MVLSCSLSRSRADSSLSQAGPGPVHDPAMSTWSARSRLARDRRRPEGFVEPMLATPVQGVPTGPGWQFEVKHDGYRMIARAENGQARILMADSVSLAASAARAREGKLSAPSAQRAAEEGSRGRGNHVRTPPAGGLRWV